MTEAELRDAMTADARELRIRERREQSNVGTGPMFDADGRPLGHKRPRRQVSAAVRERVKQVWTLEKRIEQARRSLGREPTQDEIDKMEKRRAIRQRARTREAAKARGIPLPDLRKSNSGRAPNTNPTAKLLRDRERLAAKAAGHPLPDLRFKDGGRSKRPDHPAHSAYLAKRRERDRRKRRRLGIPVRAFREKQTG